jgi:DDE superfamily endonuclease
VHQRLSLVSAVANRGELRWMVVDGAVDAATSIRFLRRLVRDARREVFLILDRLKAHRARLTRDWLAEHRSELWPKLGDGGVRKAAYRGG